jgi:transcriptional regulator with XRE-family HTH domain
MKLKQLIQVELDSEIVEGDDLVQLREMLVNTNGSAAVRFIIGNGREPLPLPFHGRATLTVKKPDEVAEGTKGHTLPAETVERILADRVILPQSLKLNAGFLRAYMGREDFGTEDMGELVGVTGCTISNWCTGKTRPNVPNLRSLSEATGVSMDKLLLGVGREKGD